MSVSMHALQKVTTAAYPTCSNRMCMIMLRTVAETGFHSEYAHHECSGIAKCVKAHVSERSKVITLTCMHQGGYQDH
jgi:hypothetical protein